MQTLIGQSLALIVATCVLSAAGAEATAQGLGPTTSASCQHGPSCPSCGRKTCRLEVEIEKEKKHCFNVECKEICVPKVTLPCWTDLFRIFPSKGQCSSDRCPPVQCDKTPRCGYVKKVKTLKKEEYSCDACGYKWKIDESCQGAQAPVAATAPQRAIFSGPPR